MPPYTEWGRSRSGCFFCFYQQKVEWVRLKQRYPELYEEAKSYEKPNLVNGQIFYWCDDESLAELEKPERMVQIEESWRKNQERLAKRRPNRSLAETLGGFINLGLVPAALFVNSEAITPSRFHDKR